MSRNFLKAVRDTLGEWTVRLGVDRENPRRYRWDDGPWITFGPEAASSVTVSWVTARRVPTALALGTNPGALAMVYRRALPVKFHHVELRGLNPGILYHGRVVSPFTGDPACRFTLPTADTDRLRLCVIGDVQPTEAAQEAMAESIARAVAAEAPDAIIQLGDSVHRGTVQSYWHHLWQASRPFAGTIPTVRVMGNHDWGYDQGHSWRRFVHQPFATRRKSYAALDVGPARLILLDCYELEERMGGDQIAYLRHQLETCPPGRWRLLFLHASLFSTGMENMDEAVQRQLLPLIDELGVHAVFYGHDHIYEHYQYAYGQGDRRFSRRHRPTGRPVHFFLSGGGGAPLEDTFGIHDREVFVRSRTWYDGAGEIVTDAFGVRPWRRADVNHDAPVCANGGAPAWCHLRARPAQDDAAHFGLEYGENAHHYLKIELEGDRCEVSVHYADGTLIAGPGGSFPQRWDISR